MTQHAIPERLWLETSRTAADEREIPAQWSTHVNTQNYDVELRPAA